MRDFLERIVEQDAFHEKWLNTLSYMENCGARKIIRSEGTGLPPVRVLKHAAEEARHAYFFKKQISLLGREKGKERGFGDLSPDQIWGGAKSKNYLSFLDIQVCRRLKQEYPGQNSKNLRYGAYLLTTYAIEVRALKLYPLYDEVLQNQGHPIRVESIIKEERQHLKEMEEDLFLHFGERTPGLLEEILEQEDQYFQQWQEQLIRELKGEIHGTEC